MYLNLETAQTFIIFYANFHRNVAVIVDVAFGSTLLLLLLLLVLMMMSLCMPVTRCQLIRVAGEWHTWEQ